MPFTKLQPHMAKLPRVAPFVPQYIQPQHFSNTIYGKSKHHC